MEIGNKVKVVRQTHETEMSDITTGDTGILCDIDYTTTELNYYVVFNSEGTSDWFNEDELEMLSD